MSTSVTIRRHRPCWECRWEMGAGIVAAALLVAAPVQAQAPSDAVPATTPVAGAPTTPPAAATPVPAKPGVAGTQKMTREEMIRLNPQMNPVAFARNYDELGVPAAIEKVRKGEGKDLFTIIAQINGNPRLLPPKKQLPVFHAYLTDPNYLVQWLGVEVVTGMKDKSSLKPLQDYIMAAQKQKFDPKTLPKYELIAAAKAKRIALYALGEIGADDSATTKLLTLMLKNDIPMEWSGGYAHEAIGKKGRDGMMILLKESETADDRQCRFICSAISRINDPVLLPDLYAACNNRNYPIGVRASVVSVIMMIGKHSPVAERMLINMASSQDFDIRLVAINNLGLLGSESCIIELNKLLISARDEKVIDAINDSLLKCDTENLQRKMKMLMDDKTARAEKVKIITSIRHVDDNKLIKNIELLSACLMVKDEEKPMNDERVIIWKKLFSVTGKIYDIELDYENDRHLDNLTSGMASYVWGALYRKKINNNDYKVNYEEIKKEASSEVKKHVYKYQGSKVGK